MRTIELLAPARNLECGIAAIDHGADAVYIGAERFGARAAAGNSVEDIAALCRYAHQFAAKVYVTVNTIVYDRELEAMDSLLDELETAGVDAILVQDMGLAAIHHPQLAIHRGCPSSTSLHASTQTDNRTIEKVKWLYGQGFQRVVLARELSVEEVRAIHEAVPDVELEVFVHGALCVSYSGLCYASQHCFRRSANRGECAQFCRLKFDLVDADGQEVVRGRHLLSLKDMCRMYALEELMEAGAVSFKIEGRLKDISYVKNVTAAYSRRLDEIITRNPHKYCRASVGRCSYAFEPNLMKTFNRGFTEYFLHGRTPDIFSPDTPKAMGEYVGKAKEVRGNSFTVAGTASFANGDGLCFLNGSRDLEGFRVNRAEGNRLFPYKMPPQLKAGMALYRNNDVAFEHLMAGKTAERKIPVQMTLREIPEGYALDVCLHTPFHDEEDGITSTAILRISHQQAQKPQKENIIRQLTKLGGTPYECSHVRLIPEDFTGFIPSSQLADLRRRAVESLSVDLSKPISRPVVAIDHQESFPTLQREYQKYPYLYNISNSRARAFYEKQGLKQIVPAFEQQESGGLLMQCRHCLRYSLGYCRMHGDKKMPWREPLSLVLPDGRHFRLDFDCHECQMNVYAEK